MNPRPKRYLPTSDGGGVVLGWQSTQPGLPRALSWVLVPPCLPRASRGAGLCTPLSGAPPASPRALPFGVELPGASSSWRAGCRGFPACLPFSAESRERARERETHRRPAPRLGPGGSVHRFGGASAGAAVCRLRVWGAERSCERQPLSTQGRRLGRGARLRPHRHPNGQTAEG